jgi:hypothetical protein
MKVRTMNADDEKLDRLLRAAAVEAPPPTPSPALRQLVRSREPVALRRPRRDVTVVAIASALMVALHLCVYGVRHDLRALPLAWFLLTGAAWVAAVLAGIVLPLVPGRGSMVPSPTRAVAVALGVPLAAVLLATLLRVDAAGVTFIPPPREELVYIGRCLVPALEMVVAPFALAMGLLGRAANSIRVRWFGAALGAGFGALGGLMLHVHCNEGGALHVGFGHAGAAVLAALAGALVTPWFLTPSPR